MVVWLGTGRTRPTGFTHSGLESQPWQHPRLQDDPRRNHSQKNQEFHDCLVFSAIARTLFDTTLCGFGTARVIAKGGLPTQMPPRTQRDTANAFGAGLPTSMILQSSCQEGKLARRVRQAADILIAGEKKNAVRR